MFVWGVQCALCQMCNAHFQLCTINQSIDHFFTPLLPVYFVSVFCCQLLNRDWFLDFQCKVSLQSSTEMGKKTPAAFRSRQSTNSTSSSSSLNPAAPPFTPTTKPVPVATKLNPTAPEYVPKAPEISITEEMVTVMTPAPSTPSNGLHKTADEKPASQTSDAKVTFSGGANLDVPGSTTWRTAIAATAIWRTVDLPPTISRMVEKSVRFFFPWICSFLFWFYGVINFFLFMCVFCAASKEFVEKSEAKFHAEQEECLV